jgi:hypothetical protein
MEPKIQLTLVRAPDDPPVNDPEYQKQLVDFYKALQDAGIEVSPRLFFQDSAPGGMVAFQTVTYLGEFGIPLARIGVPALAGAVVAWLNMRSRRVTSASFYANGRIKEIKARTPEEVMSLLEVARKEAEPGPTKSQKK